MTATMRRRPVVVGSFLKLGVSIVQGASWSYELSFPHDQFASRTVEHVAKLSAICWKAIMSPMVAGAQQQRKGRKGNVCCGRPMLWFIGLAFARQPHDSNQLCLAEFLAIRLCALPHRVPEQILQPTNHIRFIRFHIFSGYRFPGIFGKYLLVMQDGHLAMSQNWEKKTVQKMAAEWMLKFPPVT